MQDSARSQIKFFKATLNEDKYKEFIGYGNAKKIKEAFDSNDTTTACSEV